MTARILLSATILLTLGVAACATGSGRSSPGYVQELDRLRDDCTARQGILTPNSGPSTGRPQTDFVCEIRGGGGLLRN